MGQRESWEKRLLESVSNKKGARHGQPEADHEWRVERNGGG
jgi:hypothetical protein